MPNTEKTIQFLDKTAKAALYLAVFLTPLFFLPWTTNVLDFNKQILLFILVFISGISWLLKTLMEGQIALSLNRFHLPAVVFLLAVLASALFSAYPYASFWGSPLVVAAGFAASLALVLFYFSVIHLFRETGQIFNLILTLMVSAAAAAILALPHFFGWFFLPFDFARSVGFNTIGNTGALAIFLAVLLPLFVNLSFLSRFRPWQRAGLLLSAVIFLFEIAAANFWSAWLVLLIASSLLLLFSLSRRELNRPINLLIQFILLAVSLFVLSTKTPLVTVANLPIEVFPTFRASLDIAGQSLKEFNPPASWLFGSGPGTFAYDYSLFKKPDVNQSSFWSFRFNSAFSEIADRLATTGIAGFLAFLSLIAAAGWLAVKTLSSLQEKTPPDSEKQETVEQLSVSLSVGLLALLVSLFFYPLNLSSALLFWLFLAAAFALTGAETKIFNLKKKSLVAENTPDGQKTTKAGAKTSLFASVFLIISLVIFLAGAFIQSQRFLAEVNYAEAIQSSRNDDNQTAVLRLTAASQLTGFRQDNYLRDLSQIYLLRVQEELQKKGASAQDVSKTVEPLITSLISTTKAATDASPRNVTNWGVRGYIFRSLQPLLAGSQALAESSYQEAIKLEPQNPFFYAELGQVFMIQADLLAKDQTKTAEKQGALNKARANFEKALSLKPDYGPAFLQLALIDVREGKTANAIKKLEAAKTLRPTDTGLALQLGLIYQAAGQLDKAQAEFERTLALDANYSNARYYLGLIYDRQGKKDLAIAQFEKIAELNPGNALIQKILDNLKAGKAALEGLNQPESSLP